MDGNICRIAAFDRLAAPRMDKGNLGFLDYTQTKNRDSMHTMVS